MTATVLGRAERELLGPRYREILRELTAIVSYQWKEHLERSALKGFLFHGGVGVGKTAMAKRLAYELCRRFGDNGVAGRSSDEVVMILVDGADVARGDMATPRSRFAIFSSTRATDKAAAIIATTTIPNGERSFCSTMSNRYF